VSDDAREMRERRGGGREKGREGGERGRKKSVLASFMSSERGAEYKRATHRRLRVDTLLPQLLLP